MKKKKSNRKIKLLLMVFVFIFLVLLILYLIDRLAIQAEIIQYLIKKSNMQGEQIARMSQEIDSLNIANQKLMNIIHNQELKQVPSDKHAFSYKLQPIHIENNIVSSAGLATLSGIYFFIKTVILP